MWETLKNRWQEFRWKGPRRNESGSVFLKLGNPLSIHPVLFYYFVPSSEGSQYGTRDTRTCGTPKSLGGSLVHGSPSPTVYHTLVLGLRPLGPLRGWTCRWYSPFTKYLSPLLSVVSVPVSDSPLSPVETPCFVTLTGYSATFLFILSFIQCMKDVRYLTRLKV